ncbi:MAG: trigger factor [Lachnospiraceae bacterium]
MKKQLAMGLAGIMILSVLTGCGRNPYLLNITYSHYVKLCDYKGVEATKVTYDVSEDEIQERVDENMYEYATYDPITDRAAQIGDYANVDYIATIDGEENEEYSGEDEDIMIGEGYIYPEVEDALIGMEAGDNKTVEVELTEDYADEEYIGKKASVKVTLNEISEENFPEYNDDFVKENMGFDTVAEYEESLKEEILSEKEEEYKYVAVGEIIDFLLANSEFDGYPEDLYTQCEENYNSENEYTASMYGMELEEFEEMFGIDEETKKQDIEYNVNTELIIGAIAQKENIQCSKNEINQYAEDYYEEYECEDAEEFLEEYGEEEVGYQIIFEKVIDLLYDNAKFVEITEEQYYEEQEDEWYESEEEETDDSEEESDDAVLEEDSSEESTSEDDSSEDTDSETETTEEENAEVSEASSEE